MATLSPGRNGKPRGSFAEALPSRGFLPVVATLADRLDRRFRSALTGTPGPGGPAEAFPSGDSSRPHALGPAPVSSRPAPSGRSPGRRFASRRRLGIAARRLPRAGAEASSLRSLVRRRPSRSPVARRPSRPTTVPSLQGRSPSGNSQDGLAAIPRIPPESAEADPCGVPLPARRPVEGAVR